MNIKEIATKAGVSIGTVDRVLHNRGRVSKETTEKILRIVRESGYAPNKLAKRLKEGKLLKIGILLPALGSELGYWQQVMNGVKEAEDELGGLGVEIESVFYDRDIPGSFIKALDELVDKNISSYVTAPLLPDMMAKAKEKYPDIPFVFIDSSLPSMNPVADFAQDPVKAGKTAARMMNLIDPGIDKLFVIQTYRSAFNGEMRARSFIDYFVKYNQNAQIQNMYVRSEDIVGHNLSAISFKSSERCGLFVVNDGAWKISDLLDEKGLLDQFTIIGFDLSPENRERLERGKIHLIIGQRPFSQGYESVMFLYRKLALDFDQYTECLTVPIDVYLKENIPQAELWR